MMSLFYDDELCVDCSTVVMSLFCGDDEPVLR